MNKQKIKQILTCTLVTGTLIGATTCITNAKTLNDKKEGETYIVYNKLESTSSKNYNFNLENTENLKEEQNKENLQSKQSKEKHLEKEQPTTTKELKNKVEEEKKEFPKSEEKTKSFLSSLSEFLGLNSQTEEELTLKENSFKEDAFKALELSSKALKEANSEMEENKISHLLKLSKEAVNKANSYKNLIKKNKNIKKDTLIFADKILSEAKAEEEFATNLKNSYDLLNSVKNIKSNKDAKSFCTKLTNLTCKKLDKISLKIVNKAKDEYIEEFTNYYNKATSYNDGLDLSTRVNYFMQVLAQDTVHKNSMEKACINILNNKFKELKKEEKINDDFISGFTYSIHNFNKNECTSNILKTSLNLCDDLGNYIIKQIKKNNTFNEPILNSLIKHLKKGESAESPLYIEGIKLEKDLKKAKDSNKTLTETKEEKTSYFGSTNKLYDYASSIYTEGSKITSDVISTSKTVYTTTKDLYSSVKYIINTANELSNTAKTGMNFISSITGSKKEEKPVSFITSISNKAKKAYKTAKTIKTAFDYVLKANEILDNITEGTSSQQSSISPFTKKIHTLCSTARRTVAALKAYFKVKSAANSAWNSVTDWFN
ncbi:hypothetical protein [Clostridium tarantellae]|uniref:Uncharacterized protein n=1 Tax=Clostridium tarantellae TaxID=39493 RepID=A0A6I1MJV4_9CLOT|nr:hypothetical protein [Clostridium tarantellae]MPQ43806.1 hypothetical protein [Clostridium tarantellae]